MTNINLLPPEIAQKRITELRRFYMVAAGAVAIGIVVFVWIVIGFEVSSARRDVEELRAQSARLSSAKTQLQQFADRKGELQKKQKIGQDVIADALDWSKLLNEVSMITPGDVWLDSIKGNEVDGLTFKGFTLDETPTASAGQSKEQTETTNQGHKAVAKWLVRLSLIRELTDIWLTSSAVSTFEEQPAIEFENTAAWKSPHTPPSASAPSAPPAATPSSSGKAPGG